MNNDVKFEHLNATFVYYVYDEIIEIKCFDEVNPYEITFINSKDRTTTDSITIEFAELDELIEIVNDAKARWAQIVKLNPK